RDIDRLLGKKVDAIVKVIFIAWAFGIIGWCMAAIVDRSEWLISNQHLLEDHLSIYILVMFQVVPLVFAISGGLAFRKAKPSIAATLFILSIGLFLWVG